MTLWKHTNVGRVVQIIGNVVDVEFASGQLPAIYNALVVKDEGELSTAKIDVTVEVQQHLGENRVRAVAMQPTDGLVRGMSSARHRRADHGSRSGARRSDACSTFSE